MKPIDYYYKDKDKYIKSSKASKIKARTLNPIKFRLDKFHRRDKELGRTSDLTTKWADTMYTGRCSLTKLPFTNKGKQNPFSPSVDRIDNNKGYTQDNSRIVLHSVNLLKHIGTDEDMYIIAYGLLQNLTKEQKRAIQDKYNKLKEEV